MEAAARSRRESNRGAQQRRRAKLAARGDRKIEVIVTAGEWEFLQAMCAKQRGPEAGFFLRALLLGAAFAANSGTPRGKKQKGNTAAAAIRGAKS